MCRVAVGGCATPPGAGVAHRSELLEFGPSSFPDSGVHQNRRKDTTFHVTGITETRPEE